MRPILRHKVRLPPSEQNKGCQNQITKGMLIANHDQGPAKGNKKKIEGNDSETLKHPTPNELQKEPTD